MTRLTVGHVFSMGKDLRIKAEAAMRLCFSGTFLTSHPLHSLSSHSHIITTTIKNTSPAFPSFQKPYHQHHYKIHASSNDNTTPRSTPSLSSSFSDLIRTHQLYLHDVAKIPYYPIHSHHTYLSSLLHLLQTHENQTILQSPTTTRQQLNLHPFFIPISQHAKNQNEFIGFLRWPTMPLSMELPLVKTNTNDPRWLILISNSIKDHVLRRCVEFDYYNDDRNKQFIQQAQQLFQESISQLNNKNEHTTTTNKNNKEKPTQFGYNKGDIYHFVKKKNDLFYMEKFLLTKIGKFPDLYKKFVDVHLSKHDISSALITCECITKSFPSWGCFHQYHSFILNDIDKNKKNNNNRYLEARDAARYSLQMPLWTLDCNHLEDTVLLAGYNGLDSLVQIYKKLALDKRQDQIQAGKRKEQIALDRAAWWLDWKVADGLKQGWQEIRDVIATLYDEAGMNDIATFVRY